MIYLFYGPDDYSRAQALYALKASIPEDVADLNVSKFDGRKLRLDELQSACEAYPFLAERRLVVVYNALKQLRSADEREALKNYLPHVSATTDLVFVEVDDPDQRTSLYKALQLHAEVRSFTLLEGEALLRWIAAEARRLEVTLAPGAAQALAESVGSDGWALTNELCKLTAYVGRGGTIGLAEIQLLVADEAEASLFAFIDLLFGRQRAAAAGSVLSRLRELLAGGDAPHYILFMIARQVRLLLAVQSAGRSSPDQLARVLGQRPFVIRKVQEQARSFQPPELRALHDRLMALDRAIKTGQIEAETALDLLVAQLALPQTA